MNVINLTAAGTLKVHQGEATESLAPVTAIHSPRPGFSNEDVWHLWKMEMTVAGNAPRTLHERSILFKSLCRFLDCPLIDATRSSLMAWLARPNLSPKTRQNYKSFVHTLFTLLQDEGWRADNPTTRLPRSRVPRSEANPVSTAQIQSLLDSGVYAKTRMMILLAAYQGFRAVEIAAVAGENIDWIERRILSAEAKGGVEVWRPLHPTVWEHAERMPRTGFWFPGTKSMKGTHIKPSSVSNTVGAAMKRAGITGHRPHNLRAWFATELVESGADILTVQHAMRHANPTTLKHYVRPSMSNIAAAQAKLPELTATPLSWRLGASVHSGTTIAPVDGNPLRGNLQATHRSVASDEE